jgi:hypothetical protein
VKGRTTFTISRYTGSMQTAVLVLLAVVVTLVAVDAIGKLDERAKRRTELGRRDDDQTATTQKIVVDLSKRT